MNPLPPTSVTVCSRNRPSLLRAATESILSGEEAPTELIVVDQSDDFDAALAALPTPPGCELRYVHSRSRGVSSARNEACRAARGEIVVLTDDDMLFSPTWLGTLVRALVAAGPGNVVTGQVQPGEPGTPGKAPSVKVRADTEVYEGRIGKDVLFTNSMAMFRSAFDEVGPFDERLGTGSRFGAAYDNDFGFRLLEAGYRIVYVPEAVAYHRAWRSGGQLLRLSWRYGRGQGAYYGKYLSLRDRYMLRRLGATLGESALRLARRTWQRPSVAPGEAAYVLGLLEGAIEMGTETIARRLLGRTLTP